jgi:formyltetrahydrofolate hydrolase
LQYCAGELECDIPLVISNHPDLEHIARTFDIEFRHLPLNKVGNHNRGKAPRKAPASITPGFAKRFCALPS